MSYHKTRAFHNSTLIVLILCIMTLSLIAGLKCDYCRKEINGKYLSTEGKSYHDECYREHIQTRCDYCKKPIEGRYNVFENKSYHEDCYTNHIVPRCDICDAPLDGKYVVDFWGTNFHKTHSDELPECSSCSRLISEKTTDGGYRLGDGRTLCGICNRTAVIDEFIIESSLNQVKRLLASNGINDLPSEIPISIVAKDKLKQISPIYSENMKGFTDQNAQSINGKIISRESHIYILSHLPRINFESVLAHELMHVYLFENDLDLRSDIREGFCNLGSEMVYEDDNSQYSQFMLQSMKESPDPDYGEGYRKMSKILYRKGWRYVLEELEHIK